MSDLPAHIPKTSFRDLFLRAVDSFPRRRLKQMECRSAAGDLCRLCSAHAVNYEEERTAKEGALREFWNAGAFTCTLEPLIPSPRGRNYRIVSKRRAFHSNGRVRLALNELAEGEVGSNPLQVGVCVIEPEAHAMIYHSVQGALEKREMEELRRVLNHVIVKGSYDEFAVIFNLAAFNPSLRKLINLVSRGITGAVDGVSGVFVVIDPTRSGYYMPQHAGGRGNEVQKLFGRSDILHTVRGRRYLFSPSSFSQINLSILEKLVEGVEGFLRPEKSDVLLDLYSGYGIFTLGLSNGVKSALGIEISREAIRNAEANAVRQGVSNCEFIPGDINERSCYRVLSSNPLISKAILDPPRNGTKPGVIETFKGSKISRIVHLFCNIDIVGKELERWSYSGYRAVRAIPFDMFPGTGEIELMVLLEQR